MEDELRPSKRRAAEPVFESHYGWRKSISLRPYRWAPRNSDARGAPARAAPPASSRAMPCRSPSGSGLITNTSPACTRIDRQPHDRTLIRQLNDHRRISQRRPPKLNPPIAHRRVGQQQNQLPQGARLRARLVAPGAGECHTQFPGLNVVELPEPVRAFARPPIRGRRSELETTKPQPLLPSPIKPDQVELAVVRGELLDLPVIRIAPRFGRLQVEIREEVTRKAPASRATLT